MATNAKSAVIRTPEFRSSYAFLFRAKAFEEGDEPEFSITMLFPTKATPELVALKNAAIQCAVDEWGDKARQAIKDGKVKLPFRKHEEKRDEDSGEFPDGYEAGGIWFRAKSKQRPNVVGRNREDLDETSFYSGCWAWATVRPYCFNYKGNRGVAFGLNNVQKLRDDEALSGRTNAMDDFDDLDDSSFGGDDEDGIGSKDGGFF